MSQMQFSLLITRYQIKAFRFIEFSTVDDLGYNRS
jgi:hypothetical protein